MSSEIQRRVYDLAYRESQCCAFFAFTVSTAHDALTWRIETPDVDSSGVLDEMTAALAPEREVST